MATIVGLVAVLIQIAGAVQVVRAYRRKGLPLAENGAKTAVFIAGLVVTILLGFGSAAVLAATGYDENAALTVCGVVVAVGFVLSFASVVRLKPAA